MTISDDVLTVAAHTVTTTFDNGTVMLHCAWADDEARARHIPEEDQHYCYFCGAVV